jgi:hypothetical protein
MRRASCVASQDLRRVSSGWVLSGRAEGLLAEVFGEEVRRLGPTPARRVSWIPGAEGAPRDLAWRWECVLAWPEAGTMRIACEEG